MSGSTVITLLREHAEKHPGARFATCADATYTYGELDRRTDRLAAGLQQLGVARGDRVAVLSPNRAEVLELFFALPKTGAVQVPLNAYLKGDFLCHQLTDSQADVVVVDRPGLAAVRGVADSLPGLRAVVCLDGPDNADDPGDALPLTAYRRLAVDAEPEPVELTASDLMSVVYTSGTTGFAKGCMLSHGYYTRVGQVMADAVDMAEGDVLYTALPMFHGAARMMVLTAGLVHGLPVVIEPAFSASTFLSRAADVGATIAFGVGAMGMALLAQPPAPADVEHQLRTFVLIPFPPERQREFTERFRAEAWAELYGQTECVPITWNPIAGAREPASCGRAGSDLTVAILDDEDRPVPPGVVGEICLRPHGPQTMFSGYWNNAEATVRATTSLWYHTGDYGRSDVDGHIYFVDRKKDAVRRRGENVSTLEVEAAIVAHPAVAEAAVHAVPAATEDEIKVCIVATGDVRPTPAELFDYFREKLPYYAMPRYVEIVDDLPKNAVGRVMKFQLRERALSDDVWDFEQLGLTVDRLQRR
ncbi:crotonobetaine/carnitine-CoA ligase [Tamaricihabitans halophyticus]|uniref:Crotonobetaine/carnitine-CoA ligase n=1 Tax=Tamaricihabitans halophyticus TaxID=1262583 RepID=A0A4R2Q0Y8_9PSEU|nr:AMP-binding protein [Tamaricihabitans halophyticus]TCP41228.1 crotonobetaine/carnitine-CoA ligase [Tamaricihabitans halophyticus]